MEFNLRELKSLGHTNNNILYNILIIIIGILFGIFFYNNLIKISTVLVVPTNNNKKNRCNFI
jgi:hypothetical protein